MEIIFFKHDKPQQNLSYNESYKIRVTELTHTEQLTMIAVTIRVLFFLAPGSLIGL